MYYADDPCMHELRSSSNSTADNLLLSPMRMCSPKVSLLRLPSLSKEAREPHGAKMDLQE